MKASIHPAVKSGIEWAAVPLFILALALLVSIIAVEPAFALAATLVCSPFILIPFLLGVALHYLRSKGTDKEHAVAVQQPSASAPSTTHDAVQTRTSTKRRLPTMKFGASRSVATGIAAAVVFVTMSILAASAHYDSQVAQYENSMLVVYRPSMPQSILFGIGISTAVLVLGSIVLWTIRAGKQNNLLLFLGKGNWVVGAAVLVIWVAMSVMYIPGMWNVALDWYFKVGGYLVLSTIIVVFPQVVSTDSLPDSNKERKGKDGPAEAETAPSGGPKS